jgi:transcriptional regulator with XRE-family HTH domain
VARPVVELAADEWALIGEFLRRLRARRGWTQEQAAGAGGRGLSRAPLGMLENGKPENNRPLRSTLEGIQRAYDLPDEWWALVVSGDLTADTTMSDGPIRLSASGVDLDELHEKDPEAYAAIMEQARIALDRARERGR